MVQRRLGLFRSDSLHLLQHLLLGARSLDHLLQQGSDLLRPGLGDLGHRLFGLIGHPGNHFVRHRPPLSYQLLHLLSPLGDKGHHQFCPFCRIGRQGQAEILYRQFHRVEGFPRQAVGGCEGDSATDHGDSHDNRHHSGDEFVSQKEFHPIPPLGSLCLGRVGSGERKGRSLGPQAGCFCQEPLPACGQSSRWRGHLCVELLQFPFQAVVR